MLHIQDMASRTKGGIGRLSAWLSSRCATYLALTRERLGRFRLWLLETAPLIRDRLREATRAIAAALRPAELKRRAQAARQWAIEHDTVPQAATARRRELLMERIERHDQREYERQYRRDETAKKREKKEAEDRQAYSVYFE